MTDLEQLRQQIDEIDTELLTLIAKRIAIMQSIGKAKKSAEKPIRDTEREEEKIEMLEKIAKEYNIPLKLITNIWKAFFEIATEIEK